MKRFVAPMLLAALAAVVVTAPSGAGAQSPSPNFLQVHSPRTCETGCRVKLSASPKTRHWVSPHRLHADLRVNVLLYGRKLTPTYYRRKGELCVGYYSGYGATVKVNVCGNPYRLRVTTQAFRGPDKRVQVQYLASYPTAKRTPLVDETPRGTHRSRAFKH